MSAVRRIFRLGAPAFVLAAAFGSAQCGLLASPGEYTGGGNDSTDSGADGTTPSDGNAPKGDALVPDGEVVPGSIGTIALMAGGRDPTSVDDDPAWSADAWSGVLAADGTVATWRIEKSAPIVGSFVCAGLIGTTWMMVNDGFGLNGGRGTAVQSTSWAPGIVGDWKASRAGGAPGGLQEPTRGFYGGHFYYVGGTRTEAGVDGGPPTTYFTQEVHVALIDAAKNALGSSADTGIQLIGARSRAAVLFENGHVYVVGGRAPGGITASVGMAPVDLGAGTVQAFAAQPSLMNGGADHKVFQASLVVAGGYLFVAGGRINGVNAPTDVVQSAKIGGDGTLGSFQSVTSLPKPLHDAAFVAFKGRVYIIGGVGTSARSDEVYSAAVGADGKLSAWQPGAKLPAPRSDFVALAY